MVGRRNRGRSQLIVVTPRVRYEIPAVGIVVSGVKLNQEDSVKLPPRVQNETVGSILHLMIVGEALEIRGER